MKNIFNWSILLSICSIFLYWLGFWYLEGYVSYFGASMGVYNPDFSYILMSGFMSSLPQTIWLIFIFPIVSFCLQFPKSQWKIIIHKLLTIIVYIIFVIITTIKKIYVCCRLNKFFDIDCLKFLRNLINELFLRIVRKIFLSIDKYIKEINSHKVFQILKIKGEILESKIHEDKRVNFDIQYMLHYMILIIMMFVLIYFLEYSQTINKIGYNDAKNKYQCSINYVENECSSTFNQIRNKDLSSNNITWYLTDICIQQKCIIINNKEVRWIDITDKSVIINEKTK